MTTNVFHIDDTFWWQHMGTTMGTPCACICHNHLPLPRTNKKSCLVTARTSPSSAASLMIFSVSGLSPRRIGPSSRSRSKACSDLASSVVFLDLTLSFATDKSITYSTYQKPLILYLYIPPTSAHPPSCFTGTIVGNIIRLCRQNPSFPD
jgi:hypothetical protein